MKILICGKGGAGKSTVAALTAMAFSRGGKKVFLVDADESNIGLYRMMGLEIPEPLLDSLGGKKGFKEKTRASGMALGGPPPLFPANLEVEGIPGKCISEKDNLQVMSIGKIHHFGEGCACPMGNLFKLLFSSLQFDEDQMVLVDTAAGVEHFGRRLDEHCDHVICVADPSYESVIMVKKVVNIAEEAGLGVSIILNRTTPESEQIMKDSLADADIISSVPDNSDIAACNLRGEILEDVQIPGIEKICEKIMKVSSR